MRPVRWVCLIIAIGWLLVAGVGSAIASTVTFNPVADSYVSSATPDTNYGTAIKLAIDDSPVMRAYARFNVSLPAGSTVNGATAQFNSWAATTAATKFYDLPSDSWGETTVTYNNRPSLGLKLAELPAWSAGGYKSFPLPASYVPVSGPVSVALAAGSGGEKDFTAREGVNIPRLVVDYTAPATPTPTPTPEPTPEPTPTPTFSDDFVGPAGSPPDTATWNAKTQLGFNDELQCYTGRSENVQQDGLGHLKITARQESNSICGTARSWTSGRVDTYGKKQWTFGRFEAMIRMPDAIGSWPADWAVGQEAGKTWPEVGEIDAMEYPSSSPTRQLKIHQALHAGTPTSPSTNCSQGNDTSSVIPWYGAWHKYTVDKGAGVIDVSIDDTPVMHFDRTSMAAAGCAWPFDDRPFAWILNNAVGGWGCTAYPTQSVCPDPADYPADMLVDYFRVYQDTAPPPPETHIVGAVGDYASSGTDAESIAVRNQFTAANPELMLGLGDYNYDNIDTVLTGFDKIWGPKPNGVWPKFRPTPGPTHDVTSCTDTRYQNYWGRAAMKGYSFNLGNWHIVQMPSAAYRYGCDTAGLLTWLKADLAADTSPCTLAYWHEPYWTSPASHTRTTAVKPWIQALYDDNAELVLSGHNHNYERFAEQSPSDVAEPGRGIRQFVDGTGGIGLYTFSGSALANSQVRNDNTWGFLKLTLKDAGYDWQFVRATGGTFTDSGSASCH